MAITPNGTFYITEEYDAEEMSSLELRFIIEASDSGDPALTSTAELTLLVMDKNDNAPVFLQPPPTLDVLENTTTCTSIILPSDVSIAKSITRISINTWLWILNSWYFTASPNSNSLTLLELGNVEW